MQVTEQSRRAKCQDTVHSYRALCLSRYTTHKNIGVLISVADKLLADCRTDIGIYVTVEPSHGPEARRLLREIDLEGRGRVLHNLGEVPMAEVAACYQAANALLLPTLLESFSGTYVDAMQAGVPIITSDFDLHGWFAATLPSTSIQGGRNP